MMDERFGISAYGGIQHGSFKLNGNVIHHADATEFTNVMRSGYKALEVDHAKFYKMDGLSKLAFLTAEVILAEAKRNGTFSPNTAMVFANRSSCVDSDRKHQKSLDDPKNEWASPAVFVYTLPNICLGEVSIRHQLFTESCFFICEEFNPTTLNLYADPLLQSGSAEQVLCAWVEKNQDQYGSFAYLLNGSAIEPGRESELKKIYKEA